MSSDTDCVILYTILAGGTSDKKTASDVEELRAKIGKL